MILSDGTVISRAEVSPHKFGGDPMAEYLWLAVLDGMCDEYTGDIDWGTNASRFGKRLLLNDSQGFVWVARFDTEEEAIFAFNEIDAEYSAYLGDDD